MLLEAFNDCSMVYLFQRNLSHLTYSIRTPRFPTILEEKLQIEPPRFAPLLRGLTRRLAPPVAFYLALNLLGMAVTPSNNSIDWVTPAGFEHVLVGRVLASEAQVFRSYFLDCLFNAIYLLHPLYLAVVLLTLHKRDRNLSQRFGRTSLILCVISLAIFLVYPAAPPWLAVGGVENMTMNAMNNFSAYWNLPVTYYNYSPAIFAATPSLHSATAWAATLHLRKVGKTHGFAMFLFALGMWVATVYTGNHFLIDVVVGVILATFAYLLTDPSSRLRRVLKR